MNLEEVEKFKIESNGIFLGMVTLYINFIDSMMYRIHRENKNNYTLKK